MKMEGRSFADITGLWEGFEKRINNRSISSLTVGEMVNAQHNSLKMRGSIQYRTYAS